MTFFLLSVLTGTSFGTAATMGVICSAMGASLGVSPMLTAVLTGMVACNQTLTIMLTDQLARGVELDKSRFAIALEDSAVVVAPLVPWSIAGAVPLATIDAPTSSIVFACFLYLLPLCELARSVKLRAEGTRRSLALPCEAAALPP